MMRWKLLGGSLVVASIFCWSTLAAAETQRGSAPQKRDVEAWPYKIGVVADASGVVWPGGSANTLYGGGLFAGVLARWFVIGAGVDLLARSGASSDVPPPQGLDKITPNLRIEVQFSFYRTQDARVELYILGGYDFLKRDPYVPLFMGHGAVVDVAAHGGLGMRYWFNHWSGIHFNTGFLGLDSTRTDIIAGNSTHRTGVGMYSRLSFILATGW